MKFSDADSHTHRLIKKYKLTPLFWKILAIVVFVFGVGIFIYLDMPFSSVSVASASDSLDASEAQDDFDSNKVAQDSGTDNSLYISNVFDDLHQGIGFLVGHSVSKAAIQNPDAANNEQNNSNAQSNPEKSGYQVNDVPSADNLFANSAFIGDSRTEGLFMYSGIKDAQIYAVKGLNLKSVFSNAFINGSSGKKTTILADMQGKSFDKIYISFGLNELGWNGDTYINKYKDLIMKVKEVQPNAVVYVQSTFPINPDKCRFTDETNTHILTMNSKLKNLADSIQGVYYVDIASKFNDQRGYLRPEASSDGIHLNRKYCIYWLNCLEDNLKGTDTVAPKNVDAQTNTGITDENDLQTDVPVKNDSSTSAPATNDSSPDANVTNDSSSNASITSE